ncbi:hypothetical protein Ae201684P_018149 [Aphanomyces euteiches]|nr:hypothetical protein Ae201684P_018149 [Aphanomyces euteiches]
MEPFFNTTSLPRVFRSNQTPRARTASSAVRPEQSSRSSTVPSKPLCLSARQPALDNYRHQPHTARSAPREEAIRPKDQAGIMFPSLFVPEDDRAVQATLWETWTKPHQGPDPDVNFASFALFVILRTEAPGSNHDGRMARPAQPVHDSSGVLTSRQVRMPATGALLQRLLHIVFAAVYIRPKNSESHDAGQFHEREPHFAECKRLRRTCLELLDESTRKRRDPTGRHVDLVKLEKIINMTTMKWQRKVLRILFYNWAFSATRRRRLYIVPGSSSWNYNSSRISSEPGALKPFDALIMYIHWFSSAETMLIQRESANYQAMLSVTAESLRHKARHERCLVKLMEPQIDQLTSINNHLVGRVQELEAMNRVLRQSSSEANQGNNVPLKPIYEPLETIAVTNEEPQDSHVLMECLFAMARMVESSVIQTSSDVLDSLQHQIDGSELRALAEFVVKQSGPQAKLETSLHHLISQPIDVVLLNWFRLHLDRSSARPQDKLIKNFADDLADGTKLSLLLHALHPISFDFDARWIWRKVSHKRFNREWVLDDAKTTLPQIVTAESISAEKAVENLVFVAMLFGTAHFRPINTDKARKIFLHIVTSWKRVRSIMLEVRRTQEDNTSAITANLVKELKACEAYHKQMQTELTLMACKSNEEATVLAKLAHKILCMTWRAFSEQIKGVQGDVVDERRVQMMQKFTSIQPSLVRELLQSETHHGAISETEVLTRVVGIQKVLQQWFKELSAIFRHYSCGVLRGRSTTMSSGEWAKFIKDCTIVDKKAPQAWVEAVYYKCVQKDMANSNSKGMIPSEFIAALVMLADKKFPHVVFEERIRELIEKCIIPHACRSQPEVFRLLLQTADVRGVYQKFKQPLQKTFKYYSSVKMNDTTTTSKSRSTIGVAEFVMMAKDCKLIGSYVTENTVKQIFVLVQRHPDDEGEDENGETPAAANDELQVDFTEFEEALGALTEYVVANPYIPFFKRLEQFIGDMILPRARQKKSKDK